MWHPKGHTTSSKKGSDNGLVAVAIDKDKGSQQAFKWAIDHLLSKGQNVVLIHVVNKPPSAVHGPNNANGTETRCTTSNKQLVEKMSKELFLTYHCFCTRKNIRPLDVVLEDSDVVKALTDYVSYAAIENLVLGAPARSGFMRKFRPDTPSCVSKTTPEFCNVYVISKNKVSSSRSATRSAPHASPLLDQIPKPKGLDHGFSVNKPSLQALDHGFSVNKPSLHSIILAKEAADNKSMINSRISVDSGPTPRSPYPPPRASLLRAFGDLSESDTDISFVSSDRPSSDCNSSLLFDSFVEYSPTMRLSTSTEQSMGSSRSGRRWLDISQVSNDSARSSCSSQNLDEVEVEMKRLRLELKQTMDLYGNACREALSAKQQAMELKDSIGQEQRLEEVRQAEEAAISAVKREEARCKAVVEAAQQQTESKNLSGFGGQALRETLEMKTKLQALCHGYRRYSIEEIEEATDNFDPARKIGEGGYGPVYKCYLDHTSSAVKVLRPDAAQGRTQFLQEIEVLSCIRHPNMVLLLGACPEYGILVYEYMSRGSLDDCLFRKGNLPAMSWQLRFRIAADITTGLLFLHQTKPEPIVHRDLKPANILLDQNYVSKISDVGLAKLVPQVAENATQCYITSTAGTLCYIDPEYQQTGMLGVKSDVYSLGIILLQLITARPPMGLAHHVEKAIERGVFSEMLDPAVHDWPAEETMAFTKLALRCAQLRRRDRPDLGKDVLPELIRLKEIAEERMAHFFFAAAPSPTGNQASLTDAST